MTTFGLPPDDVGIHSGVTTAVDQGGAGAYTIPAFKHYIAVTFWGTSIQRCRTAYSAAIKPHPRR